MSDSIDTPRIPALVELLDALAFVAIEHGESLDLVRFAAFVDLYARHLETTEPEDGRSVRVPFEAFVRDERLLGRAAEAAGRASGVPVRAPEPLGGGVGTLEVARVEVDANTARAVTEPEARDPRGCRVA